MLTFCREKFGDLKFDVEEGKKENRSQRTFVFTMKDFVDKYKTEDVYMVHSIHKRMRGVKVHACHSMLLISFISIPIGTCAIFFEYHQIH